MLWGKINHKRSLESVESTTALTIGWAVFSLSGIKKLIWYLSRIQFTFAWISLPQKVWLGLFFLWFHFSWLLTKTSKWQLRFIFSSVKNSSHTYAAWIQFYFLGWIITKILTRKMKKYGCLRNWLTTYIVH